MFLNFHDFSLIGLSLSFQDLVIRSLIYKINSEDLNTFFNAFVVVS